LSGFLKIVAQERGLSNCL